MDFAQDSSTCFPENLGDWMGSWGLRLKFWIYGKGHHTFGEICILILLHYQTYGTFTWNILEPKKNLHGLNPGDRAQLRSHCRSRRGDYRSMQSPRSWSQLKRRTQGPPHLGNMAMDGHGNFRANWRDHRIWGANVRTMVQYISLVSVSDIPIYGGPRCLVRRTWLLYFYQV